MCLLFCVFFVVDVVCCYVLLFVFFDHMFSVFFLHVVLLLLVLEFAF